MKKLFFALLLVFIAIRVYAQCCLAGSSEKTDSYSAVALDSGKMIRMNCAKACTFTLPNPVQTPVWSVIIDAIGYGTVTVSGNGIRLNGSNATVPLVRGQMLIVSTNGTVYHYHKENSGQFNDDTYFKGPNPYVDVRWTGVRAVNPNIAPVTAGITADCVAGSKKIPINTPSSFVDGDGVDLFGCGASHSMSTPAAPTVTPATASAPSGTGAAVAAPPGSVSGPCYRIVGRNVFQGLTAPSPEVCVVNGVPLGARYLDIISIVLSYPNTNTVTTAARLPEVLTVGDAIFITSTSLNGQYGGWQVVDSIPNNTTFTYKTGNDVRAGAPTVMSTGGTLKFYNCNHLSLPMPTAGSGIIQYAIYKGPSGNERLYAVSTTANTALQSDATYMKWDDFGSPMMNGLMITDFWPTAVPASATPNTLVTRIASGAGTTTLTVVDAPSNNRSATSIEFDNAPNIVSAFALNPSGAMISFPVTPFGLVYVVNSYLDLSPYGGTPVSLGGQLYLNDTLKMKGVWRGDILPGWTNTPQFGLTPLVSIVVNKANPGIVTSYAGWSGVLFKNLAGNMYNTFYVDGGSIPTIWFENCGFAGGGNRDYMGINYYQWANYTAGMNSAGVRFRNVQFNTDTNYLDTFTQQFVSKNFGQIYLEGIIGSGRGFHFQPGQSGGSVIFDMRYEIQAPNTPMVSVSGQVNDSHFFSLSNFIEDTGSQPQFTNFLRGKVAVDGLWVAPSNNIPTISGLPIMSGSGLLSGTNTNMSSGFTGFIPDGTFETVSGGAGGGNTNQALIITNKHQLLGQGYSLFTGTMQPAAPTCQAVTAGPPYTLAQTTSFAYMVIYPNGGAGPLSPRSAACSANGTSQQIQITIPAAIPGAAGYAIFGTSLLTCADITTTTLTYTYSSSVYGCGQQPPSAGAAGGGPAGMVNDKMWAQRFKFGNTVVGSLPSASANAGTIMYVTDSTAIATEGQTCTGGSSNGAIAISNGVVWKCF